MKPGSGFPSLAILPRPTQARNSGRGKLCLLVQRQWRGTHDDCGTSAIGKPKMGAHITIVPYSIRPWRGKRYNTRYNTH